MSRRWGGTEPAFPARTSAIAESIATYAAFDFGAVATCTTASPSTIRPSGIPIIAPACAAANALGDKIEQWERWRDNRPEASPPPAATGIVPADVAPAGRRPRMVAGGATWIWVGIGIAVVVGVWIANVL